MVNKASDILARVLVGTIWNVDHLFHPSTPKIKIGA